MRDGTNARYLSRYTIHDTIYSECTDRSAIRQAIQRVGHGLRSSRNDTRVYDLQRRRASKRVRGVLYNNVKVQLARVRRILSRLFPERSSKELNYGAAHSSDSARNSLFSTER